MQLPASDSVWTSYPPPPPLAYDYDRGKLIASDPDSCSPVAPGETDLSRLLDLLLSLCSRALLHISTRQPHDATEELRGPGVKVSLRAPRAATQRKNTPSSPCKALSAD
ncbi:hypothetical protein SKAU_G00308100 [Synaphobranchus kaupii]|uniref:Uncharacterized protein n=1 Tax=Synaphobranchus kaupii TaxID=118154 RepID=A0A9Q1IK14_SYNKA|nr:hypothetical protein SKAU_G00308100 [Synaphobranchus kaupii]